MRSSTDLGSIEARLAPRTRDSVRAPLVRLGWLTPIARCAETRRAAVVYILTPAHARRRVFYRLGILPRPYQHFYLRVVVEYPTISFGGLRRQRVTTAFPSASVKQGEAIPWKR